ncbi:MAG: VOC family protein [Calditrichaeota bacterium]|nr:MAG: VOC family protein [Calditrichota bacterium]
MKIKLASIFVEDQMKALKFYTDTLGFIKKEDIDIGEYKWLTVVSPEGPNDLELLLEPNAHPAAKTFQKAIFDDGIPATTFFVDDVQAEFKQLQKKNVAFSMEPTEAGSVKIAVFNDTCGNFIQITQVLLHQD